MACLAVFLLILKARRSVSLRSPWGTDSSQKHQHCGLFSFFFFFYFKDRKVALATEQTTFLFPQILGVLFLWPSANLLVYASYSTTFQSLVTLCIPTPPASLRERRLLSLGSLWLPEILGDTVFFISLTSCHLFLLSVYVPCLVQLRSSNGSRGMWRVGGSARSQCVVLTVPWIIRWYQGTYALESN